MCKPTMYIYIYIVIIIKTIIIVMIINIHIYIYVMLSNVVPLYIFVPSPFRSIIGKLAGLRPAKRNDLNPILN